MLMFYLPIIIFDAMLPSPRRDGKGPRRLGEWEPSTIESESLRDTAKGAGNAR